MPKGSAAVPIVNQKGERSMQKVKVERYVAGKKPSFAQEEEEEYTTDEDEEQQDEDDLIDEEEEVQKDEDEEKCQFPKSDCIELKVEDEQDDDDDDDPRLRRLKNPKLIVPEASLKVVKIVQPPDDDEDEQEILLRHKTARTKTKKEPIGAHVILSEPVDQPKSSLVEDESDQSMNADDILGDIRPTWWQQEQVEESPEPVEDEVEAKVQAQTLKMVNEDLKQELEMEARAKQVESTNEVDTDDEDEEIAFEKWHYRELKRIWRDRSGGSDFLGTLVGT